MFGSTVVRYNASSLVVPDGLMTMENVFTQFRYTMMYNGEAFTSDNKESLLEYAEYFGIKGPVIYDSVTFTKVKVMDYHSGNENKVTGYMTVGMKGERPERLTHENIELNWDTFTYTNPMKYQEEGMIKLRNVLGRVNADEIVLSNRSTTEGPILIKGSMFDNVKERTSKLVLNGINLDLEAMESLAQRNVKEMSVYPLLYQDYFYLLTSLEKLVLHGGFTNLPLMPLGIRELDLDLATGFQMRVVMLPELETLTIGTSSDYLLYQLPKLKTLKIRATSDRQFSLRFDQLDQVKELVLNSDEFSGKSMSRFVERLLRYMPNVTSYEGPVTRRILTLLQNLDSIVVDFDNDITVSDIPRSIVNANILPLEVENLKAFLKSHPKLRQLTSERVENFDYSEYPKIEFLFPAEDSADGGGDA